jgi:uncharacterized membrane protein
MRGLAILIMIEAHIVDAWTRQADRRSLAFGCASILAGFAAPMFLFLAGLSAVLGAAGSERRLGDPARSAARIRRRGWEVFGLAYLFRIQAYLLNPKAMLTGIMKVDILNIMGPSIAAAAGLWQAARTETRRLVVFAASALAVTLITPLVRTAGWIDELPSVLQWYLRPTPGRNNFTFFPWAGFVFAGAFLGILVGRTAEPGAERRRYAVMGASGLLFAGACYAGSYLPSIYPDSQFWTSSPMFFLLRVGLLVATLSAIYAWEHRPRLLAPGGRPAWSPMGDFGRASLFVYWVHVELVYGVVSTPLHRNLSLEAVGVAFALFASAMFALVMLKNLTVAWWKAARATPAPRMVEKV